MSSAVCFNLDQSKILSPGNELSGTLHHVLFAIGQSYVRQRTTLLLGSAVCLTKRIYSVKP